MALTFQLHGNHAAAISVLDILGKEVLTIGDDRILPGRNEISIDISGLEPGLYFIKLRTEEDLATEKIVIR